MGQSHAVGEVVVRAARTHCLGAANDLSPVLLGEETLDLRIGGPRALRARQTRADGQERDEQGQREGGAGTARSIQWPVALQSFSNAARS